LSIINIGFAKGGDMDMKDLHGYHQYVWGYFIAYANARLSTFRFYLIFCTILIAGLANFIGSTSKWFAIFLSVLLTFLSFIYWKIDVCHKELIDHAIEALEYVGQQIPLPSDDKDAHLIQLFCCERDCSKGYKRFSKHIGLDSYFTYAICICVNMVFIALRISGIIFGVAILVS
jgi:hypothetical protein